MGRRLLNVLYFDGIKIVFYLICEFIIYKIFGKTWYSCLGYNNYKVQRS